MEARAGKVTARRESRPTGNIISPIRNPQSNHGSTEGPTGAVWKLHWTLGRRSSASLPEDMEVFVLHPVGLQLVNLH